jgi:hypothetical protein
LACRKERSGYRNLILTISPRKERDVETPETPKQRITTILATLMPSAGVRRPRMSRFGGSATAPSSWALRDRLQSVGRLADDLDVLVRVTKHAEAVAHERLVIP